MANFVTTEEINTYLWTSWEDTLINVLNGIATAYIKNYLRVTDLNAQSTYTETQDYTWNNEYMLSELNPSNLTLVNGSAVVWNYNLTGRKLTFEFAPENADTVFNKITFTYDYGYSTITDDIKAVVYSIVWYFYNARKTAWIGNFTQWQISITYEDTEAVKWILENNVFLKKYIKNDIIC